MDRMGSREKDAFGRGLGLAHQFGLAMGKNNVTSQMFQRAITNPIKGSMVAAALRGEIISDQVQFDDLLRRECNLNAMICQEVGLEYPGHEAVEQALRKVEKDWGGISVHDRVIPTGFGIPQAFQFFYQFNENQKKEGKSDLKLYHTPNEEWWRSDKEVEYLPTEFGVLRQDLKAAMQSTDLAGRPFYLTRDEQISWAKEQGGDNITSSEETLCLFIRSIVELNRPLWGAGHARGRNFYGSSSSLGVDWDAGGGLNLNDWDRGDRHWGAGALVRKFLVFGA